jgi:hypothetical protein
LGGGGVFVDVAKLSALFGWATPTDHGAVGDGVTNDYAAMTATITAAGVDGTIFLPAGKNFLIGSNVTWLNGQKVIGPGATLSAATTIESWLPNGASGIEFHGVTFSGWKRAVTQTSLTHTVERFVVDGCKFTGQREAGISLIGVASKCRVVNNEFFDIGAASAVSMVTACYIGADDATGVYTGQGAHIITGNTFTNIINPAATALEVHAILVRGRGCVIASNTVDTVSSGTSTSCEGFYIDCLNSVISDNTLTDAGNIDFITLKGDLATGGGNRVTNNVLKWVSHAGVRGIGIFAPRTTVSGNTFFSPDSGAAGVIYVVSDTAIGCVVKDNEFYGGNSSVYILLRAGQVSCTHNKVFHPALTTAVGGALIVYQAGASAATDISIENNEVYLSSAWTSVTSYHVVYRLLSNNRNIDRLRIRNNRAWNVSAASGTWRIIELTGGTGTHTEWDISLNETNSSWVGTPKYVYTSGNLPTGYGMATGLQMGSGGIVLRLTQANAATLIADTSYTFIDGDTIEYTDPAAAGNKGIVCTTAGAGGTAVFKAFGVIAA